MMHKLTALLVLVVAAVAAGDYGECPPGWKWVEAHERCYPYYRQADSGALNARFAHPQVARDYLKCPPGWKWVEAHERCYPDYRQADAGALNSGFAQLQAAPVARYETCTHAYHCLPGMMCDPVGHFCRPFERVPVAASI